MRICMLLRNPFTRDARVLREARTLVKAGHAVTVIAVSSGDLPAREDRDGFTILRSVRSGPLAGPTITGAAGGVPSGRTPRRPAAAVWLRDVLLTRRFARVASAVSTDVYHAHDLNTLAAAVHAAGAGGARVVYDAHELYPDLTGLAPRERERWKGLEQRLIGRTDAVIVPTSARADEMHRRYGVDPAVVMNCPETSNMPSENGTLLAPYRRPDELLLVYAGGFTPNRGLDNVIDAATAVDGVRLVMIGWGPLEHTLRTRSASDRVVFAEAVDPDELIGVLTGADIGIAPYVPVGLNNFLAAPNKVFEYLHAGLAIAASDLPDIRKIVEAHDVGELFDASDVTSIARALRALVADPQRLEAAKRNARAAAGLYTWDAQAAVLLDVYARIKQ